MCVCVFLSRGHRTRMKSISLLFHSTLLQRVYVLPAVEHRLASRRSIVAPSAARVAYTPAGWVIGRDAALRSLISGKLPLWCYCCELLMNYWNRERGDDDGVGEEE